MRPSSIVKFERIYLASLVLVLVQQIVSFFLFRNMFNRFSVGAGGGADTAPFSIFMIFATLFGLILAVGLPLLFWWLAARKRQEFAKWVLLVLSVLSALNWLLAMTMMFFLPAGFSEVPGFGNFRDTQIVLVAIDLVSEVLGIVALTYLFRHEAVAWFRSAGPAASAEVFR